MADHTPPLNTRFLYLLLPEKQNQDANIRFSRVLNLLFFLKSGSLRAVMRAGICTTALPRWRDVGSDFLLRRVPK